MKGSGVLAIVAVFVQMLCHRSSKKLECSKNNVFILVKIINHEKIGNPAFYTVIKDPKMMDSVLPHPKKIQHQDYYLIPNLR